VAEGDTILRAARRIEGALAGEELEVRAPNPRGRAARVERLDGRVLERVEPRGKHLLLRFGDLILHSHLGMSGSWRVAARDASFGKPIAGAWVLLSGGGQQAAQFGGPTLRVLSASQLRLDPILSRLGPDVLGVEFDPTAAVRSLRTAPDRALGEALLDQTLIAGIGNIFKSEACFAARLDPWRRTDDLTDEELLRGIEAARDLMRAAADSGRHPNAVYRHANRPCPRCGTSIRSRGQGDANRTTYWCPSCQPSLRSD
jgi:endonuclease-8